MQHLVTGGAGFIGSRLTVRQLGLGHDVVLDNLTRTSARETMVAWYRALATARSGATVSRSTGACRSSTSRYRTKPALGTNSLEIDGGMQVLDLECVETVDEAMLRASERPAATAPIGVGSGRGVLIGVLAGRVSRVTHSSAAVPTRCLIPRTTRSPAWRSLAPRDAPG